MTDRKLGYLVLGALALGIAAIASIAVLNDSKRSGKKMVAIFERVGNLKIEDAVYYRGTEKGQVESIENIPRGVCVTLRVRRQYVLHSDYAIRTLDRGIMGDRMVVIEAGNPLLPITSSTDTLRGTFMIGVSEAIGLAWQLKDVVHTYKRLSDEFRYGTVKDQSFTKKFNNVVDSIDKYTIKIKDFCDSLNPTVDTGIDTLQSIIATAQRLSDTLSKNAPSALTSVHREIFKIDSILPDLDTMLTTLQTNVSDLSQKDRGEWADVADSLNLSIKEARKLINEIRIDALSLRPVLF